MNEKVSVIMGIYNCSATLPKAIESIISQTYQNWQLIMCDDCSTDDTYNVAVSYQKKYPQKIIVIKNKVNSKLAFTLNHCLEYADGEFIARMDGDDTSEPKRFEKQVSFLNNNPNFDLVGTAMQRFSDKGLANIDYPIEYPDRYTLRNHVPFNHATIMCRRKVYDVLNGYTVAKRTIRGQDYDLWFRFYYAGFNGCNLMEPLYNVREDKNAIKRRTIRGRFRAFETTRFGFKLLNYPKWWIIEVFILMIFKCITPVWFVVFYRWLQSKINK